MTLDAVLTRIDNDLPQAIDRLMALLRIPSISTDPAYQEACRRAADWLVADLRSFGVSADIRPCPGLPMVVGHSHGSHTTGPHLLFYGHYDVQPVDPLPLWDHDPFEPMIEERPCGKVIRGRGASDDKGQLMTFLEACRAWRAVHGELPCRIGFFLEGEEESGSPSMAWFLEEHRSELTCDMALICDTGMIAPGVPSIASQLRGILKDEFTLTGPKVDLHSGHYGGPALNPLHEITRIVASFHNTDGSVAVEGFYDGVHEVPAELKRQWEGCGFDEAAYLGHAGITRAHGETGFSVLEQQWGRPTLEINGLWGGYNGVGAKTVIPSQAHCKFTCRLVGEQDPEAIHTGVRAHVEDRLSKDCAVSWDGKPDGSPASVMDIDRPEFRKAKAALAEEWQRDAVFIGMGGSIPVVSHFRSLLGMNSLLVGFASDDDLIHSPNEKYDLASFQKGIRSWARILDALAGETR